MVIGSANVDLTVKVDRLPEMGETVSGGEFYTSFGGKGANQAVAALKAGAEVRFLAKVGGDPNGEAIIHNLQAHGLSSEGILRDESRPSGVALIMVDREGNNAIGVAPGSNKGLTEEDIRRAASCISWGKVLLIQLEIPLPSVKEALRLARAHNLITILNPAPARQLTEEIFPFIDILTPNDTEAMILTGLRGEDQNGAIQAARKLKELGCGQVIVTRGKEGCCWVKGNSAQAFPPFSVTAIDSTAAGDAFNGALACAIAEGRTMSEAIRFASAAGAVSATRRGAQDSLPTRAEITRLLAHS
jgi:ribokinase